MKMASGFLSLALITVFLCSGCSGVQRRGESGFLEPQAQFKFNDIPVPSGFGLVGDESYVFESSGLRVLFLSYTGKADIDKVVNFYKEQMSMYDWHLLNVVEYGERLLNFDRAKETCIVRLLPKGKNVVITISVGPKTPVSGAKSKALK